MVRRRFEKGAARGGAEAVLCRRFEKGAVRGGAEARLPRDLVRRPHVRHGQSVEQLRKACKHTIVDQNPSEGVASQTALTRYMQKRGTAGEGTPESRIRKGSPEESQRAGP